MMASLTYPTPPPPLYHSIVISRLASTVYFGYYPTSRSSFIADCLTITVKIISDALYIRYIVTNYTIVFGILDIISDTIFIIIVLASVSNNDAINDKLKILKGKIQHYMFTCCGIIDQNEYMRIHTPKLPSFRNNKELNEQQTHAFQRYSRQYDETRGHYAYTSIPSSENDNNANPLTFPSPYMSTTQKTNSVLTEPKVLNPIYSSGQYQTPSNTNIKTHQRQPFKPSYYAKSGIEHEEEYSFLSKSPSNEVNVPQTHPLPHPPTQPLFIHSSKNTMYVNFDNYDNVTNNYANIFVSPFYDKNGNSITIFSSLCKCSGITPDIFFVVGNICHLIYQIMIYINITNTCKTYTILSQNSTTNNMITQILC